MEEDITTFANFTLKSGRITQSGTIDGSSSFTSIPLRAYASSTMTKSSRPFFSTSCISCFNWCGLHLYRWEFLTRENQV
ncbi:MAG: hypothetical protein CM15mP85_15870 [Rhodobacterales bacterium]|nr:MAG: hypothetical protein CM15mP85_15870 [Rhodobacterales bacterium]